MTMQFPIRIKHNNPKVIMKGLFSKRGIAKKQPCWQKLDDGRK